MLHKIPARYQTIGLFVLSYALLYFIYAWFDFLPKWDAYGTAFLHGRELGGYLFIDPLFLGIPLVGFALMWVAIRWYANTFNDEQILSVPFALGFVVLSYASFFLALVMYYWNNAYLSFAIQGDASPFWASFIYTIDFTLKNFLEMLLQSPFFVLVLSALAGWVVFVLVHKHIPHHMSHRSTAHPV